MRAPIRLLILLPLLLAGCNGSATTPSRHPAPEGQAYLFEVSYVNFAWGRQINGMFIDREGNIISYDHSYEIPAAFEKINRGADLTHDDLRDLYTNRETVGEVDPSTLERMIGYVDDAAKGVLSDPVQVCADAGGLSYIAYRFNSETQLYHRIELYQAGDWAFRNESVAAALLFEWLVEATGLKQDSCTPS